MSATPLARHLIGLIRAQGPIPIARYMAEALGNPEHGYYMTRDPFGARGDFVTAPEVSQMFGELLGAWAADTWLRMGSPDPFVLAELGPGRGTLMADALRATRSVPGFRAAADLHLVETSPALRAVQQRTLNGEPAEWHDVLSSVPARPTILLANELFDALPVRQYQRAPDGWHERLIDVASDGRSLRMVLDPGPADTAILAARREAPLGAVCETSPAAVALAQAIAERLAAHGGAALIVDYGHVRSGARETLQAVRAHKGCDILAAPGEADICAHVDFEAIGTGATQAGAAALGPVEQGRFLRRLGIEVRAAALKRGASADEARDIDAALARLTDPAQMGSLFKVLCIASHGLRPEGFDDVP